MSGELGVVSRELGVVSGRLGCRLGSKSRVWHARRSSLVPWGGLERYKAV